MTLDEMKSYVDECLTTWPESIKTLDITGGECMINRANVEGIIEYGNEKGLTVSILTNAFWAKTPTGSIRILRKLKNKGLTSIVVTTGENHMKVIPFSNARNAAIAAARIGLKTFMRVESHYNDVPVKVKIATDEELKYMTNSGRLLISYDTWMDFVKKGRTYKSSYIDGKDLDVCPHLFTSVPVNPYGEVFSCCGLPATRVPYLRLGNIHRDPIKEIYERAFSDVLKVWIKRKGPYHILKYVQDKTGWKFDRHTSHICDHCRVIMTDPRILPFLRENYFDYIREVAYYSENYEDRKDTPDPSSDTQQVQDRQVHG